MALNDAPQHNKQHAVPQNIMDVEFKLIGELTMRQFFYLLVFIGTAYGLYIANLPVIIKWPLILILILAGLAFAFLPLEDRGMDEWIVNFFRAVYKEQQRVWRKSPTPPSAFLYESIAAIQQELITLAPTSSRRKLEQFLDQQYEEDQGDEYDQLEAKYILKVQEAFADVIPSTTTVIVEETFVEEVVTKPVEPKEDIKDIGAPSTAPKPTTEDEQKPKAKPKAKPKPRPKIRMPAPRQELIVRPITPDRHSGRKFTSMLPEKGGTIVLPIRGERTIKTTGQIKTEEDTTKKTIQLKQYMQQVKATQQISQKQGEQYTKAGIPQKTSESAELNKEAQALITKLKADNETLKKQIQGLQQKIVEAPTPEGETRLNVLQQQQKQTLQTIAQLTEQITSIEEITPDSQRAEPSIPESIQSKLGEIPENLQPIQPNVIAGIVRNIQGRGLPGIMVVIKNERNDPIKAMKTNSLGEFTSTTALTNGRYKLETDVTNTTGFKYEVIDLEAKGEIIPAMELVGN